VLFAVSILQPGEEDAVRRAHDRLREELRPWSTGGTIHNLSGLSAVGPDRVKLAFTPADYTRLTKAKAKYDPDNMFRINLNIPPAT
jgi:FAD/FMN-containing dehydrogenase